MGTINLVTQESIAYVLSSWKISLITWCSEKWMWVLTSPNCLPSVHGKIKSLILYNGSTRISGKRESLKFQHQMTVFMWPKTVHKEQIKRVQSAMQSNINFEILFYISQKHFICLFMEEVRTVKNTFTGAPGNYIKIPTFKKLFLPLQPYLLLY